MPGVTKLSYPIVRETRCVMEQKCVNCMVVCPEKAIRPIEKSDGVEQVAFIGSEKCSRCGLCYQVCPTGAIEDTNADSYRERALTKAIGGAPVIFVCEGAGAVGFDNGAVNVPDLSILSWRDLLRILSTGSPVRLVSCGKCKETRHLKALEAIFINAGYEGVFKIIHDGGSMDHGQARLDEKTLEEVITSYEEKIPFPGTAWVEVGKECTLCGNCARTCPTGAFATKEEDGKITLVYEHGLCKGCPVCKKACPERCITIEKGLRPDKVLTREVKCEGETSYCRGCDRPMTTDAALARVREKIARSGMPLGHLDYCLSCRISLVSINEQPVAGIYNPCEGGVPEDGQGA